MIDVPADAPKNDVIAVPLSSIVTIGVVTIEPTTPAVLSVNATDVPAGIGLPDVSYTIAVIAEDPQMGIVNGVGDSSM